MTEPTTWYLRDADTAFDDALAAGVLNKNLLDYYWVLNFMYMGTDAEFDYFKHRDSRVTIKVSLPADYKLEKE